MAVGDLTTLASAKEWLGLSDVTMTDNIMQRLITQLSATILGELQRASLISQIYTDVSDGFGSTAEYLDNWPVTSVAQVAVWCTGSTWNPCPIRPASCRACASVACTEILFPSRSRITAQPSSKCRSETGISVVPTFAPHFLVYLLAYSGRILS